MIWPCEEMRQDCHGAGQSQVHGASLAGCLNKVRSAIYLCGVSAANIATVGDETMRQFPRLGNISRVQTQIFDRPLSPAETPNKDAISKL